MEGKGHSNTAVETDDGDVEYLLGAVDMYCGVCDITKEEKKDEFMLG